MSQHVQQFVAGRLPSELTEHITGNVPLEIKELPLKWLAIFRSQGRGFAGDIAGRLRVVDVSARPSVDDPEKLEGKVTCEIEVTSDMCNEYGVLHEACIFYLVDECSTISMVVAKAAEGNVAPPGVSQTINTLFHSSAKVGTKLRIINSSYAAIDPSSPNAGKTEVWDHINHRLIASGTQLTMPPSRPRKWMGN